MTKNALGNMGDNIKMQKREDGSSIFFLHDETGLGTMTCYSPFEGVFVLFNDFHLKTCYSAFKPHQSMFTIDYCKEGRIENSIHPEKYTYISAGDLQMEVRTQHCGEFYFPLKHYHGITISILFPQGSETIRTLLNGFPVDVENLKNKFCRTSKGYETFIMRSNPQTNHILAEIYQIPEKDRVPYLKIKVLELLLYLDGMDISLAKQQNDFLNFAQVTKIKSLEKRLTSHLNRFYTLTECSSFIDMPLTSMKKAFRIIYGKSIYAYMKEYRINAAALLLQDSSKSILEIANDLGYQNPSKFSAAFKSLRGLTPRDYRKTLV